MFFCGNLLLLQKWCWFFCYVPQKATFTGFIHVNCVIFNHTFSPRVQLQNLTPCIYSQAVMATNCHGKHKATDFPCTCKLISLMFFRPIISLTHLTLNVSDRAPVMVTHATPTAFYLFPLPASFHLICSPFLIPHES